MINLVVSAVISGLSASIGGLLVAFYLRKSLKNDLKAEIMGFFESEDAPNLLKAVGANLGAGFFSRAGGLNPMKGNINLFGMKIPKVIAFGVAQKFGLLPGMPNPSGNEGVAPAPNPEVAKYLEGMK